MSSSLVHSPKASGLIIADRAKHVTIHQSGLENITLKVAQYLIDGRLSINSFSQFELHPDRNNRDAPNILLFIDTLNFCFWSSDESDGKWTVELNGKAYTGYFALCAAIFRAKQEGHDISNAEFWENISFETLKDIFRSDSQKEIPLLKERFDCIREVSKSLNNEFGGKFENCIKKCENSALKLLELIVEKFPCFRDEANYKGFKVSLYKRAQILVGDIWACFRGQDLGEFHDIEDLSMFADYRIPQVLVYFGAMTYSEELKEKLDREELLENGCEEEVEIRGCSIYVVDAVCMKLRNRALQDPALKKCIFNSVLIDHFLWDYRRAHADEFLKIPFHRTRCIYY